MRPYWSVRFGNPSSIHREGVVAQRAIEDARERAARAVGGRGSEITFTSGGTEANQLALLGMLAAYRGRGKPHVVTTSIEHPSILDALAHLEEDNEISLTRLPVSAEGLVDPSEVRKALAHETVLVSVQYVNSEVGSVQPIREIAKVVRRARTRSGSGYPYFHTDASQAFLCYPINVLKLGVDLLTLDAQKIYGPKGVGLLWHPRTVALRPIMYGGGQEGGLRPGTESVPLIVGFAEAIVLAEEQRAHTSKQLKDLQSYFIDLIKKQIPGVQVNGGMVHRAPNNINISIPGFESEFMVLWLDAHGIACGSRSACMTGDHGDSYVLFALGKSEDVQKGSLRFTLGKENTKDEIRRVMETLVEMLAKIDSS